MKALRFQFLAPLFALALPMIPGAAGSEMAASVDPSGNQLVLLDGAAGFQPYRSVPRDRGYNVVVWDPRGEFESGGVLEFDNPDYESYYYFAPRLSDDYFSFTALSSEENLAMPTGSQIWLSMEVISAPEGSEFSFWEKEATAPTFTLPGDASGGSFSFVLSEWESGVPDSAQDPGGNIEGRAFSTTVPGDYYIKVSVYDGAGVLGRSEDYTLHFTAVPEPGVLSLGLIALGVRGLRRCR